ncbi:hypothetical protein H0R92_00320 [Treponema sp. OMZ 840]|uniref:hypothetical protein n=1 Tax=Treponema sp. OMZ 840 TaxID=244313 RepID=UPI003D94FCC4
MHILKYIRFSFLCCIAVFFISCLSTPKDSVSQPDAAQEVSVQNIKGKPEEKKTDTVQKTGKKLTVVYDETDNSAEKQKTVDLLAEYKLLCENINIKIVNSPSETKSGFAFTSAFSIAVTDKQGHPAASVGFTVKYPSSRINDNLVFATEEIQSDKNGIVVFSSPLPEFSCNTHVSFYPTAAVMDSQVLQYAEENSVKIPYKVYTDKTNKSLSVSILDYTESGKAITSNSLTSSSLLKALFRKGFRRAGNSDFINEIHNGNIDLLYKNASALFRGQIDYLIFGTVKYESPVTKTEDELYEAVQRIDLFIMDIKTSDIILQTSYSFSAKEKNQWQVLDTIRNKLLAPAIAEYIYYNF